MIFLDAIKRNNPIVPKRTNSTLVVTKSTESCGLYLLTQITKLLRVAWFVNGVHLSPAVGSRIYNAIKGVKESFNSIDYLLHYDIAPMLA